MGRVDGKQGRRCTGVLAWVVAAMVLTLATVHVAGAGPILSGYSSEPLLFGSQYPDWNGLAVEVPYQNSGDQPLVAHVSIAGNHPNDFELLSNDCGTVQPGRSCVVRVRFVPKATGTRQALLTFTSNAGNAPTVTRSLEGYG